MDRERAVKYLQSFEKYGSWGHIFFAAVLTLFWFGVFMLSWTDHTSEFKSGVLITTMVFVSANLLVNAIQSRRIGTAVRSLENPGNVISSSQWL